MGHKIGYARVGVADPDSQAQFDALAAVGCFKVYTDEATATTADQPRWRACLNELQPGDTLIIWKIDRIALSQQDLVTIAATLAARGVSIESLTDGIIDTTTVPGKLAFDVSTLLAAHEAALVKERILASLAVARAREHKPRRPRPDP